MTTAGTLTIFGSVVPKGNNNLKWQDKFKLVWTILVFSQNKINHTIIQTY